MVDPNHTIDDELVRRLAEGDEAAFTALYRRRHAGVYRFALHMTGSIAVAEDGCDRLMCHQTRAC